MPSNRNGFRGISIKKEMIEDIEKFIKNHPERGYKSIAEFVAESVRCRIDELKKHYKLIESE
jgi:hypothetical protein